MNIGSHVFPHGIHHLLEGHRFSSRRKAQLPWQSRPSVESDSFGAPCRQQGHESGRPTERMRAAQVEKRVVEISGLVWRYVEKTMVSIQNYRFFCTFSLQPVRFEDFVHYVCSIVTLECSTFLPRAVNSLLQGEAAGLTIFSAQHIVMWPNSSGTFNQQEWWPFCS